MVGIASYGAYIPRHRLTLGAIGGRSAREGGPEKAVAWNDEDSVTMAVSAAVNCLRNLDRGRVDAVLRQNSSGSRSVLRCDAEPRAGGFGAGGGSTFPRDFTVPR